MSELIKIINRQQGKISKLTKQTYALHRPYKSVKDESQLEKAFKTIRDSLNINKLKPISNGGVLIEVENKKQMNRVEGI